MSDLIFHISVPYSTSPSPIDCSPQTEKNGWCLTLGQTSYPVAAYISTIISVSRRNPIGSRNNRGILVADSASFSFIASSNQKLQTTPTYPHQHAELNSCIPLSLVSPRLLPSGDRHQALKRKKQSIIVIITSSASSWLWLSRHRIRKRIRVFAVFWYDPCSGPSHQQSLVNDSSGTPLSFWL